MTQFSKHSLNLSNLNFRSDPGFEFLAGDYNASNSPPIGLTFDIVSPRISERISFHGDLFYLNSDYDRFNEFIFRSSTERHFIAISLQQLKIPLGIRYTFTGLKFAPYFNAGFSSTIHIDYEFSRSVVIQTRQSTDTFEFNDLPLKNTQFGLWGGAGVSTAVFRKFIAFVELRFERTNGVAPFAIGVPLGQRSTIENLQVLVGLRTK